MAQYATAQETLSSLRHEIARIEGRLAETLDLPAARRGEASVEPSDAAMLVRRNGLPEASLLPIGVEALDGPLGGGLPRAALIEIHGAQMHDAGAASGFALGMASLVVKQAEEPVPLLWIAADGMLAEAGGLYASGILGRYGIASDRLILSSARRIEDALWVAEEAAALAALSVVVLEVGPAPRKLDLTATRRLHRRAQIAGRPLFLLRHSGRPEPTAAPVRLQVAAAPAGERPMPCGTLAGSIGPPAVTVTISRSPNHMPASATLEWSDDARIWRHRKIADAERPPDSGPLAAPSADGPHIAPALGTVVAHGHSRRSAA
jgi:protein ImuA